MRGIIEEAPQSFGAGALDHTVGEGCASVVLLGIELKPEDSFDESIAGVGFDPAPTERQALMVLTAQIQTRQYRSN